jgi:hypothetical protein
MILNISYSNIYREKIKTKKLGLFRRISYICYVMRDELTNKTMNMTDKELKELYAQIQKGYDELMERNRQTIEWMKSVGLQK